MSEDEEVKRIAAAFNAGSETAKGLRIGDFFRGASPAAEAAGFIDLLERSAFIQGYLRDLPRPIATDAECRIVQLGEVKS